MSQNLQDEGEELSELFLAVERYLRQPLISRTSQQSPNQRETWSQMPFPQQLWNTLWRGLWWG